MRKYSARRRARDGRAAGARPPSAPSAHDPILFVHGWNGERIELVDDDQQTSKEKAGREKS